MHTHHAEMLTSILDYWLKLATEMSASDDPTLDSSVAELNLAKLYVKQSADWHTEQDDTISKLMNQNGQHLKHIGELTNKIEMLEAAIN